ncbi:MAG: helix-turn-helix domain-containing protein [Burkholderiaceae bacterium]
MNRRLLRVALKIGRVARAYPPSSHIRGTAEAAAYLGVSRRTLQAWLASGKPELVAARRQISPRLIAFDRSALDGLRSQRGAKVRPGASQPAIWSPTAALVREIAQTGGPIRVCDLHALGGGLVPPSTIASAARRLEQRDVVTAVYVQGKRRSARQVRGYIAGPAFDTLASKYTDTEG